jgi:hypothetical protein
MSVLTSDYISSWYFLQKKANPYFAELQNNQPYYVIESLDYDRSISTQKKDAIQGDAGTHIIDQSGITYKTSISSNVLIYKALSTTQVVYKDIFDILLEDYYALLKYFFVPITDLNNSGANFNDIVIQGGNAVFIQNLFDSAQITLGPEISCTIDYICKYNNKFNIDLNDYSSGSQPGFDFVARTARNYDCRFYIDGVNEYYIKSGSLTIKPDHEAVYIANTLSAVPFYSPQGYHVSGSITVLSNSIDAQSIPNEANISLLIGDRYLELGQSSVKSSYKRSMKATESATTLTISFDGYARLGAGINLNTPSGLDTWVGYLKNKLDEEKFTKVLQKLNALLS